MLENNQKLCTKCNIEYPITNFYKNNGRYRKQCKSCYTSYSKQSKEDRSVYHKQYRETNKEYIQEHKKNYRVKKRLENNETIKPLENEIFKDISGYEGLYIVSNLGRVVSLEKNNAYKEYLKSFELSKGYPRLTLNKNGKGKHFFIHRLVAKAFIPNPENKPQINHINGIKTDYSIDNLEWCTPKENIEHSIRTGLAGTNSHRKHKTNKSGYIGVHFHKHCNKWTARILVNSKRISLGYFIDVIEAAKAYDKALDKYLDNTYQRNFPI